MSGADGQKEAAAKAATPKADAPAAPVEDGSPTGDMKKILLALGELHAAVKVIAVQVSHLTMAISALPDNIAPGFSVYKHHAEDAIADLEAIFDGD